MFVRKAKGEDPEKQSDLGLHILFRTFWQITSVQKFRISNICDYVMGVSSKCENFQMQ